MSIYILNVSYTGGICKQKVRIVSSKIYLTQSAFPRLLTQKPISAQSSKVELALPAPCSFRLDNLNANRHHVKFSEITKPIHEKYSVIAISLGHFSPNNSRRTSMACPSGRAIGVFSEFGVRRNLYRRSSCTMCSIRLHYTAIYRDSTVFQPQTKHVGHTRLSSPE